MVQLRSQAISRFRRDAWLEVNLDRLEANAKKLHQEFQVPLIPVVKADAYGHGAGIIAKTLDAYSFVHGYGVASIDEALQLRLSTSSRIIVLGISPEWALDQALEEDIELTIVDIDNATSLNDKAKQTNKIAKVHLKLDTGMNRIGFKSNFNEAVSAIEAMSNLQIESIFTHFADPSDMSYSEKQIEKFDSMTANLNYPKHPASSQAAQALGNTKMDFVRCGIDLYGLGDPQYETLMSLQARISFIKDIKAGETVSYKQSWQAKQDTRIATLPLGYADGLVRSLSNRISGFCNGREIQQVGLITMDQVMFDIGSNTDINVGDIVELLGPNMPIDDWCQKLGTINYEIVSSLNLRLPKSYTRN